MFFSIVVCLLLLFQGDLQDARTYYIPPSIEDELTDRRKVSSPIQSNVLKISDNRSASHQITNSGHVRTHIPSKNRKKTIPQYGNVKISPEMKSRTIKSSIASADTAIESKQSSTVASCKPMYNVAFIKTHKAGSSTIANILQRFGITHHLNFALPRKMVNTPGFNYINRAGEVFSANRLIPLPNNKSYNILWSHSIYNRTAFRNVLPADTVYISILREPFQQFVSSLYYYGILKAVQKIYPSFVNETNPISSFLAEPKYNKIVRRRGGHYGYGCNKQAEDLGFGEREFINETLRQTYIKQLDHDFTFIMIMEHFDESLLILKKKLCWSMKDILYIPKNINTRKPKRVFSSIDYKRHEVYSQVDHSLYSYFTNVYIKTVLKQNKDFFKELTHFKKLLILVKEKCTFGLSFTVEATPWHEAFRVDQSDCYLMIMTELMGLMKLRNNLLKSTTAANKQTKKDIQTNTNLKNRNAN